MYLRIKDAHAVLLTFTQYARYMCIYIYIKHVYMVIEV
jgi:hypothetical protein